MSKKTTCPKFISEGSSALIYKPHLNCLDTKTNKTTIHTIGKIFKNLEPFQSEKYIFQLINKLDPKNEFTLPLINSCIVKLDNLNKSKLDKKENKFYYQLIIKYGGVNLRKLEPINFIFLFSKFKNIFVGCNILNKFNYIHQDIKPDNILYNKKQNKLFLIDFGLLINKNKIFYRFNKCVLGYQYLYYPPEYIFLYYLSDGYTNLQNISKNEILEKIDISYDKVLKSYNIKQLHYLINIISLHLQNKNIPLYVKNTFSKYFSLDNINVSLYNFKNKLKNNINKYNEIFPFYKINKFLLFHIKNKIDVYMLGISLLEMFYKSIANNEQKSVELMYFSENKSFYIPFLYLLYKMCNCDCFDRMNINDALNFYQITFN